MIRSTTALGFLSAVLYLGCGSAEASSLPSQIQKKAQAYFKANNIAGSLKIASDDVPPPVLRNVDLRISVMKQVEDPSGATTLVEVCSFNEQVPLYDRRQSPDQYTLPVSQRVCPALLNGKNTVINISTFTLVAHAEMMGSIPQTDVKILGVIPWVSNGDAFEADLAFSASRDLQVSNLLSVSTPEFGQNTGTRETITVYADMNELQ
jgi:hypothetical protein